jgi:NAD(P)-dependent dehydrogenase (short-subunit alcohol dehydrogenase family)
MPLPRSPHAVITGAGSGFGRALALLLASRGARLVLSDVNEATVTETVKMALSRGAKEARSVACDVSKLDQVEALAGSCGSSGWGPVDLVVNNAGVGSGGRIGDSPMSDWRWTIEIDLFGVIYGCHAFVPMLRRQGHGHVLNVASAAGLVHMPEMGAYNVAKAGVVALTETLSAELLGTSIGATVLCPTFFQTNIVNSGRFVNEKAKSRGQKMIAKGKTPESIAAAAVRAVEANRLYCVPMMDGRILWHMKRVAPGPFVKLLGTVASKAIARE